MLPNIYILEKFIVERVQERQRGVEHEWMLACLARSRCDVLRRRIRCLGRLFVALGTRMKQKEEICL